MAKVHYFRVNNIRIYVDTELINFLDYAIREQLKNDASGLPPESISPITLDLDDYMKTHRFLYEPEVFAYDFYEICKEICANYPYRIYVDKVMLRDYFKDFSIKCRIINYKITPQITCSAIDIDGLTKYIQDNQSKWANELPH